MCAVFFKMDKARYVYNTGGLLFIEESCGSHTVSNTVIPRLTSDPANEFFGKRKFFRRFMDSANEYGFG